MTSKQPAEDEIRHAVAERYSKLARDGGDGRCHDETTPEAQLAAGEALPAGLCYSRTELDAVPPEVVDVSAGCGNPLAIAQITPGSVVLDLGSGGGIDVFLAAIRTGPAGRAIGVDATPDMVWRARRVALENGIDNVDFRLGEIEHLPVESGTVDFVISNCVINLSPDKDRVFKEALRVLKPGGRLAVSDIVTLRELPPGVREDPGKWARCISGAISEDEYLGKLRRAGFVNVDVIHRYVYEEEQARTIITGSADTKCGCCNGSGPDTTGVPSDFDYTGIIASDKIVANKTV